MVSSVCESAAIDAAINQSVIGKITQLIHKMNLFRTIYSLKRKIYSHLAVK